jgi:hypothetical protein
MAVSAASLELPIRESQRIVQLHNAAACILMHNTCTCFEQRFSICLVRTNTSMRFASASLISGMVSSYLCLEAIARQVWASINGYNSSSAVIALGARLPLRP